MMILSKKEKLLKIDVVEEKMKKTLKGKPTLIDLWANWCGPCHAIAPTVHNLEAIYEGKLNVLQIDVDTEEGNAVFMAMAIPYDYNAIPYLIVFDKDGNEFDHLVGADPNRLTKMVEQVMK
ncbi:MAG: thioredoxin [Candidatus Lokiarchaeota archaeon]|nr:thioredoxin [Candidatus Lokiarchaeota archaeon]